jgi:hypothetical protein
MGNPNHDDQGRFSGSDLRRQIKAAMTYAEAKEKKNALEAEAEKHSKTLKGLSGGGAFNMTPEHVKTSPEYRKASSDYAATHAALRSHNEYFLKTFAKEYKAERSARYK